MAPNGTRIVIADANPPLEIAADRARVRRAAAEGQHALGNRTRGHALPGPDSRPAGRQHHRVAHPHPRRRSGPRHGPLPHGRLPVDLLLQRLGSARVRGPGSAIRPAAPATASSSRRGFVIESWKRQRICRSSRSAFRPSTSRRWITKWSCRRPVLRPDRDFGGQTFCRSGRSTPSGHRGACRDSTRARPASARPRAASPPCRWRVRRTRTAASRATRRTSCSRSCCQDRSRCAPKDKARTRSAKATPYVIPPGLKTTLTGGSADLQLLEVSLPASFETRVHADTH